MKRIIKPARPDLVVRRPESGQKLSAQGEQVEWSAYWQRRLNEGDVAEVPNNAQAAHAQPAADPLPATPEKKGGAK